MEPMNLIPWLEIPYNEFKAFSGDVNCEDREWEIKGGINGEIIVRLFSHKQSLLITWNSHPVMEIPASVPYFDLYYDITDRNEIMRFSLSKDLQYLKLMRLKDNDCTRN